eukprot:CAMPEP_0194313516 /NCGR_PEP_ID=MMETSP0171-20130528/10399_1 /TAXON_ID=218684 /ORGANISM="Corethron pennatum, Strain L29A3" /LENGTH=198 /DNA_ID=CAMNT_0039068525 /DNA_START=39 /DNA_END=635 /DNA_ORIENTATION=+
MISLRAPLSLLLLHHSLLPFASAAVASDVDWVIPDGTALAPLSFSVGDSLTFTWSGRTHNVFVHPSGTCEETSATEVAGTGAAGDVRYDFTAEDVGTVTFACDVGSHCEQGQLLVVTVTEGYSGWSGASTAPVTDVDATANTTGEDAATDALRDATGETEEMDAATLGVAASGVMTSRGDVLSIQFLAAVLTVLLLVK